MAQKKQKKQKTQKEKTIGLVINIVVFVVCIVVAYLLATFLFISINIEGSSMEPTLHNSDRVLIFKRDSKHKHGDVVVFETNIPDEQGGNRYFVKRIIGLPGDLIEIKGGRVYRNGEMLKEDYVYKNYYASTSAYLKMKVSEGEFFFLGDNRGHSSDSRELGTYKLDKILGRVVLRYKSGTFLKDPSSVKRTKNIIGLDDFAYYYNTLAIN
ncbi:MAG TPA: signal peptidase I [Clostridiales bacterium]|nr:signal peptidase I [Clostridiales bacterium]